MTTPEHDELDISELRVATERLAEQVSTLSVALQTVNHLQARQLETDRRVSEVATATEATKGAVAKSFEDLEERTGIARTLIQRRLRIFAIGTACVALVVSLAAIWLVHRVEQREVTGQHSARLALCHQRNADAISAAAKTREYFTPKLAQEQANPKADPVLISILQALAQTTAQTVKCS